MGHSLVGHIPTTRRWQEVIRLLALGEDVEWIAAASSLAAENSLPTLRNDPAFVSSLWLLIQIPRAARSDDFANALHGLGLDVGPEPGLMDVASAFTDAVDQRVRGSGRRSDFGEMAQLAAVETLTALSGRELPALFGATSSDVKLAFGRLATVDQFRRLARDFFARLTRRCLDYYLSRALAHHVGPGKRFRTLADQSEFSGALDLHCREASRIIQEFSGDWLSKAAFEDRLTPEHTARFAAVAFRKIQKELQQRRGADG
jgi:hypothetical protein